MEINFETETMAKLFTGNFYGKYDRETGTHRKKALNFFAKPIADKYTNEQLLEEDIQVFGAGYPHNGLRNKSTSNYDFKRKKGSRFGYCMSIMTSENKALLGHIDFSRGFEDSDDWERASYTWQGKRMHKRGYGYSVEDH